MAKQTVEDINAKGKRVLMRVDFNVPLDEQQHITDDTRITASLPTIRYLIEKGARLVLMSHLGRPKGQPKAEMSLAPAATRVSELLGKPVRMLPDCVGEEVERAVAAMLDGDIVLLENLRFHPEEEKNDPGFAKALAKLGDVYVNDAFGTAHRAHASTEGVTHYFKQCAAGFLVQKEIQYLGDAVQNPRRPFVAILGGAKISGKIDVIQNLLAKVDALIVGGGMAYTFFKAEGLEIGHSLLEEDKIELAGEIMRRAKTSGADVVLPVDCVVADELSADAQTKVVDIESIPSDWQALDIGPKTVCLFKSKLAGAKTVIWNGPMGVFEIDKFAKGTKAVAQFLAEATRSGATTIIGGGDSAAAIASAGLGDQMTHISTGGGASLEYLEGKVLPGVAALTDK
jgi:phosphoglycerate kinase